MQYQSKELVPKSRTGAGGVDSRFSILEYLVAYQKPSVKTSPLNDLIFGYCNLSHIIRSHFCFVSYSVDYHPVEKSHMTCMTHIQ